MERDELARKMMVLGQVAADSMYAAIDIEVEFARAWAISQAVHRRREVETVSTPEPQ